MQNGVEESMDGPEERKSKDTENSVADDKLEEELLKPKKDEIEQNLPSDTEEEKLFEGTGKTTAVSKEDEELQNIEAQRPPVGQEADKANDISLERIITRTIAADFCVTPTRSIDTPTRAIEGLKRAVRDSPGLWKSTIDPVDFSELETSASNFFELNQLSEQIAATADSMTSEGDIAELLGVASEAEEKMRSDREAEENKLTD